MTYIKLDKEIQNKILLRRALVIQKQIEIECLIESQSQIEQELFKQDNIDLDKCDVYFDSDYSGFDYVDKELVVNDGNFDKENK